MTESQTLQLTATLQAMEAAYKRHDIATVKALANEFALVLIQMNPNEALAFVGQLRAKFGAEVTLPLNRWRGVLRPEA